MRTVLLLFGWNCQRWNLQWNCYSIGMKSLKHICVQLPIQSQLVTKSGGLLDNKHHAWDNLRYS